jgi:tripartite-type tricarboxylate transporter receptor subunit TctC
MKNHKAGKWLSAVWLTAAFVVVQAHAQQWPERPLRLIVPGPPGSATDIPARILAQNLGKDLQQTIVVENRPGAGGSIAAREVAQAKPDGYTLMLAPASTISITPWTLPGTRQRPDKQLTPIGMLAYTPLAIAVKADSPIQSADQLLDGGSAKPDTLVVANPGIYTMAHLTTELISERTPATFRAVPFNGFSGSLTAVQNGDAVALIDGVSPILAQAQSKTLRILAVTSQERLPGLEQYPLLKDVVPNTFVDGWFGLFTTAQTPAAVAQRLSGALNRVKADEQVSLALRKLGMYTRPDDTRSFAAYVKSQSEQWGRLIAQQSASQPKSQ